MAALAEVELVLVDDGSQIVALMSPVAVECASEEGQQEGGVQLPGISCRRRVWHAGRILVAEVLPFRVPLGDSGGLDLLDKALPELAREFLFQELMDLLLAEQLRVPSRLAAHLLRREGVG